MMLSKRFLFHPAYIRFDATYLLKRVQSDVTELN